MQSSAKLRSLLVVWLGMNGICLGANEPAPTNETEQFKNRVQGEPAASSTGISFAGKLPEKTFAEAPLATPPLDLRRLSLEELLSIQVTSVSRSPVALADTPAALQVITDRDARRSGATSIPEVLRLANNLNVAQKNAYDWGISARGFNTDLANKLLVLIDGRSVYTPLFSGVRWDAQDVFLEDLQRIEVVSGPGGSLWGTNAVNGVINITTKSAKDTQGSYGEFGGGNQVKLLSGVRYGGQLGPNTFFRIYGKYTERSEEAYASGARVTDDSRMTQGGFRMDSQTGAGGQLTLQGDYYDGIKSTPQANDSRIGGGNLLGRWSQVLSNGSDASLQFYYDRTYLRKAFPSGILGSAAGLFTENLDTYDLDFQQKYGYAENRIFVWGLGYRLTDDQTKDAPSLGFDPRSLRQNLFSGFAQGQFLLAERLLLTVGTKLEHNDYTGFEIEPSIRLQKEFENNQMAWTAVSRAVRTPSRIDRDILQPSQGQTILGGNKNFQSENVIAYEAGYRGEIGSRLIGSISVFYNSYTDIRSLSQTSGTFLPLFFANDLKGETHGVELAFNTDLAKWWRLNVSYTLLRPHLHVRAGGSDFNNTLNETSDPQNQVALSSSMDLPRGFELDAQLRWIDTLYNNNDGKLGTVPSYTELNLRLGYHFSEQIEFSLVGQNLLHDHHPEFGAPGADRVEIRRSIFAKVAFRY